ncbi:MAG TPA: hypothetical protein VMT34_16985 [Aggregatilineales bacterium]|nr:hypothetical protein [Aggregatilineales bacterium]
MPDWGPPLLIGAAIGVIVGYFVARQSAAVQPIQGGVVAHIGNYVASSAVAALAPTMAIAAILFHIRFLTDLAIFVALVVVAAVALIVFGAVEAPTVAGRTP